MARTSIDQYAEASTPKGSSAKKLDRLEVKPAKNGGHVVEHHFDNSGSGVFYHRPDVHAFGSGPEVIHHLMDHLGVKKNEMIAHFKGKTDENEEKGGEKEYAGGHSGEKGEPKGKVKGQKKKNKKEEDGDD